MQLHSYVKRREKVIDAKTVGEALFCLPLLHILPFPHNPIGIVTTKYAG